MSIQCTTSPAGKPIPFEFTLTERATEKRQWQRGCCAPDMFLRNLEHEWGHKVGPKDGSGIIAGTFPDGAHLDGRSLEAATGVILDFDGKKTVDGETVRVRLDVDDILGRLPFRGVAHSSYSHTPDFPMFRVILPGARKFSRDEHAVLWRWVALPGHRQDRRLPALPRWPSHGERAGLAQTLGLLSSGAIGWGAAL